MQITITNLASTLQSLLMEKIVDLAEVNGFFRRTRNYTLAEFVQTLLFGWIEDPKAPLESFAPRLNVAPQSLAERLDQSAVQFCQALLEAHLEKLFDASDPSRQRLLNLFSAVIVEDSTTITLPAGAAADWPGCGNGLDGLGSAAIKINIRYELICGRLEHLGFHAGKDADQPLGATAEDLPEGSLHLIDLGYFDTSRWLAFEQNRYFISRAKSKIVLLRRKGWQLLPDFLKEQPEKICCIDRSVVIHKKNLLAVRLVALRCPEEVANRRKQKLIAQAKDKGKSVTQERLIMCEWTVLITNVPESMLKSQEVWILYRCRWQVELWIKRGKQFGGWEQSFARSRTRRLVELWLKLTGTLIVMWAALLRGGGPLARISMAKRMRQAKHYLSKLAAALEATGLVSVKVLEQLVNALDRIRRRIARKTKPSSWDLLEKPTLVTRNP